MRGTSQKWVHFKGDRNAPQKIPDFSNFEIRENVALGTSFLTTFLERCILCNLEQEYRVGSFHLLSLGQDGRYLRFFFPHLLFFFFAIVASRFDASQKTIPLHDTVAQNSVFFSHQPYHFTHKSISNYCFFKKNLVTAASLLFCYCHSRSLGDRELRDVNKTGMYRIYLLPPPLPLLLPRKRSIQIFCCEEWWEKAFPDTHLGFGNLECCKNTCVGKKARKLFKTTRWKSGNAIIFLKIFCNLNFDLSLQFRDKPTKLLVPFVSADLPSPLLHASRQNEFR